MLKKDLENLVETLKDAVADKDKELSKYKEVADRAEDIARENTTLADAVSDKEKEATKWKNAFEKSEKRLEELKAGRRDNAILEEELEVVKKQLVEVSNKNSEYEQKLKDAIDATVRFEQLKEHYNNLYNQQLATKQALDAYRGSYNSFLKNIQGGLENATDYKALMDALYFPPAPPQNPEEGEQK